MRLTRALSRPVERHVMHVDVAALRLDAPLKESGLETSLIVASSLAVVASLVLALVVDAVAGSSSAPAARLLKGAEGGLIASCVLLVLGHLVRYLFWYARSHRKGASRSGPSEFDRRIPLLMSTDWDFVVVLAIVLGSALSG